MSNQIKRIIFVGHFAIDNIIRFKRLNKASLGGSVSYCSLSLRTYTKDVNISIISHIGETNFNKSLLKSVKKKNIDLRGVKYSEVENTNFILDYFDHTRTLTLKSRSPTLKFKDIPQEYLSSTSDVIVLVPLCDEISYEFVSEISKLVPNIYIGIDLQGFIRNIDKEGKVSYEYNEEKISNIKKIIRLVGDKLILKGSEEEMKLLANEFEDSYKVMKDFEKYNTNGIFIMTLGEKGSLLSKKGYPILDIPAFKPKRVSDETGAGDVYFSIFLYEFFNSDKSWSKVESCAFLASAAASFLVEKRGPSGFETKLNVLKRVSRKEYIN